MVKLKYVFKGYLEAFSIIKRKKLKIFYILPGVLSFALFFLLYYLSNKISLNLFNKLGSTINLEKYNDVAYYLVKFFITIIVFLIYFLIYKGLTLVLLSPFLNYISEKVEEDKTGINTKFSFKQNIKFIGRGIVISSKYILFEILGTFVILTFGFIPIINISTPLLFVLMQGFFAGASIIDYTLERKEMNSTQSFKFVQKNFLFTTLSGVIFILFFMLPILGMFMAPLLSCVAITRGTLEILEEENN